MRIRVVDIRRSGNPGSGSHLPAGCRRPIRLLGLCAHRTGLPETFAKSSARRRRNRSMPAAGTPKSSPGIRYQRAVPRPLDLAQVPVHGIRITLRITVRPCRPELRYQRWCHGAPNGGKESRRDCSRHATTPGTGSPSREHARPVSGSRKNRSPPAGSSHPTLIDSNHRAQLPLPSPHCNRHVAWPAGVCPLCSFQSPLEPSHDRPPAGQQRVLQIRWRSLRGCRLQTSPKAAAPKCWPPSACHSAIRPSDKYSRPWSSSSAVWSARAIVHHMAARDRAAARRGRSLCPLLPLRYQWRSHRPAAPHHQPPRLRARHLIDAPDSQAESQAAASRICQPPYGRAPVQQRQQLDFGSLRDSTTSVPEVAEQRENRLHPHAGLVIGPQRRQLHADTIARVLPPVWRSASATIASASIRIFRVFYRFIVPLVPVSSRMRADLIIVTLSHHARNQPASGSIGPQVCAGTKRSHRPRARRRRIIRRRLLSVSSPPNIARRLLRQLVQVSAAERLGLAVEP